MQAPKIMPAILSRSRKEYIKLLSQVKEFEEIHIDCMDGKFVRERTYVPKIDELPKQGVHMHWMFSNPEEEIRKTVRKRDTHCIHAEIGKNELEKAMDAVLKGGGRLSIALNPETPITKVPELDSIEEIMIMCVSPGRSHQAFIESSLKKIRDAADRFPNKDICVDGGISETTIRKTYVAGARRFVSHSAIFSKNDKMAASKHLEKLAVGE